MNGLTDSLSIVLRDVNYAATSFAKVVTTPYLWSSDNVPYVLMVSCFIAAVVLGWLAWSNARSVSDSVYTSYFLIVPVDESTKDKANTVKVQALVTAILLLIGLILLLSFAGSVLKRTSSLF